MGNSFTEPLACAASQNEKMNGVSIIFLDSVAILHIVCVFLIRKFLRKKPLGMLNVDREVLFIEISLKCYPEDIFSSCKV